MAQTAMRCLCRLSWAPRCPSCRTCYTCCNCTWAPTGLDVEAFDVVPDAEVERQPSCWREDRLGPDHVCDRAP